MPQGRIGEGTGSPLLKGRSGSGDHSAISGIENDDDSSEFRLLLRDLGVTLLQEKLGVLQPLLGASILLRFVDLLDRDDFHVLSPKGFPISGEGRGLFANYMKQVSGGAERTGRGRRVIGMPSGISTLLRQIHPRDKPEIRT